MDISEARSTFVLWDTDTHHPMFYAFGGQWAYDARNAFPFASVVDAESFVERAGGRYDDCKVVTLADAINGTLAEG